MNQTTIDNFMQEYFASEVTGATFFRGVPVLKCPLDLWVYQEIIVETKPTLIVECGTAYGGSALWMASILDQLGAGMVFTIDRSLRVGFPPHPRITYREGSSTSTPTMAAVALAYVHAGARTMVVLDSDHKAAHVRNELDLYAPLVTPGQYLIVEDTCIGHPVFPEMLPGPAEALEEWLPQHPEFEVDRSREKFGVTWNPGGWLRRRQ